MAVRLDKWLWAVRVYKTRAMAKNACATGRVTVNDVVAKPATKVDEGDLVEARRRDRTVIYRVVRAIEKRVSAGVAAGCVEDLSPPPRLKPRHGDPDPAAGRREPGAGRPTKRERRQLNRLRDRGS